MTTEDDFQKALDKHPEDWQTRLVFADWLEERGDIRAEGYRALAAGRYVLCDRYSGPKFRYVPRQMSRIFLDDGTDTSGRDYRLPKDWYEKVRRGQSSPAPVGMSIPFKNRREAEDAAARAFAQLPARRRARLVKGRVEPKPATRRLHTPDSVRRSLKSHDKPKASKKPASGGRPGRGGSAPRSPRKAAKSSRGSGRSRG